MRLRWTRLALGDLAHAHDHVARENPRAAAGLVECIEHAAGMLVRHSHLGRAGRVESTRELPVAGTPFIIVYRLTDRSVEILAVIHGARKWPDGL